MVELSIIIVNYNTSALTEQTVASVQRTVKRHSFEIIVADNSSDKFELFKNKGGYNNVRFLEIENNGFGNACNLATEYAQGEFILFLNSDTIVFDNAIDGCLEFMKKHKSVGITGARLTLTDGRLDHGCKRGFPTPRVSLFYFLKLHKLFPRIKRFGEYTKSYIPENAVAEVDCVSGAFLLIRKSLFSILGGFDEDFFMYGEDIDLCYRAKKQGSKIVYYGKSEILHLKGQSGLHTKSDTVISHFYNSMRIFYNKHYKKKYGKLVHIAVMSGITLKHLLTQKRKPR